MKLFNSLLVLALGTLTMTAPSPAASLQFVRTPSRLPVGLVDHSLAYDGQDSIYIIGGHGPLESGEWDSVARYSLETGAVDIVGKFRYVSNAAAVADGQDILHFGGYIRKEVHRYDTTNGTFIEVNSFPKPVGFMASAFRPDDGSVYFFGGYDNIQYDSIFRYNLYSNEMQQVGQLPETREEATAVWASHYGYIFGGILANLEISPDIFKFDPSTNTVTRLQSRLPNSIASGCSVYNGRDIYILDGEDPTPSLVKFDPNTEQTEYVLVSSWPEWLTYASCVYVPKLGRMYIVGGLGNFEGDRYGVMDHISYIEVGRN